jgi:hypothetical protein
MRLFLSSPTYSPSDHLAVVDEHAFHGLPDAWQGKLKTQLAPTDQLWLGGFDNYMDDHHLLDQLAHSQ